MVRVFSSLSPVPVTVFFHEFQVVSLHDFFPAVGAARRGSVLEFLAVAPSSE